MSVLKKKGPGYFENRYLKSNYWPQVFMKNYAITSDFAQTQEKTVYKVSVNAFLKEIICIDWYLASVGRNSK